MCLIKKSIKIIRRKSKDQVSLRICAVTDALKSIFLLCKEEKNIMVRHLSPIAHTHTIINGVCVNLVTHICYTYAFLKLLLAPLSPL